MSCTLSVKPVHTTAGFNLIYNVSGIQGKLGADKMGADKLRLHRGSHSVVTAN